MEVTEVKYFIEAALLAAARPLSIEQIANLFDEASCPAKAELREAVAALQEDYKPRGIEIAEVASGFRMQVTSHMGERLERLWEERPPRYSRALFETLALIAYRQPMTRGEIEEVRGVAVSSNIVRSLLEREWVRIVGHRDVPGRPAMFGTTRQFLDYFGLKKLDDLPPLADLADWESLRVQLNLPAVKDEEDPDEAAANDIHLDDDNFTPLSVAGTAGPESDDAFDNDSEPAVAAGEDLSQQVETRVDRAGDGDAAQAAASEEDVVSEAVADGHDENSADPDDEAVEETDSQVQNG